MLSTGELAELAARFWSINARTRELPAGRLVTCSAAPDHPLGTYLMDVSATSGASLDQLLADADATAGRPCGRIFLGPRTPDLAEAHLALRDWVAEPQLQLVLSPATGVRAPTAALRPVGGDADWSQIEGLFRIDHLEEDARAGRRPRSVAATRAAVLLRRRLAPTVEYFGTDRAGQLVGCIALWVSDTGVALVEDVFVHPDARGAGLATEMLRFAVGEARRRGAGPIVIGAEVDNTPKQLYARFGFEPAALIRSVVAPPHAVSGCGHGRTGD